MQADYVQRLRLTFRQFGPTRYIGHLDVARTLERSLNRAKIPLAYTQGFNRRPRMQMATALPLGFTSDCELADIWLVEKLDPADAQTQIMSRMAPGIDVYEVREVELRQPALQTRTLESHYTVTMLDPVEMAALRDKVSTLLAADELLRERGHKKKRKTYDLRPLILALAVDQTDDGLAQLQMKLTQEPSKTGRPDEVLMELGYDPLDARIHRTRLVLSEL